MVLNNDVEIVPTIIDKSYTVLSRKIKRKQYDVNVSFIEFDKGNNKYKNTLELRDDVYKVMCDKLVELRKNDVNAK